MHLSIILLPSWKRCRKCELWRQSVNLYVSLTSTYKIVFLMGIKCSHAFLNYEGCVIYTFNISVSFQYSLKTIQLDLWIYSALYPSLIVQYWKNESLSMSIIGWINEHVPHPGAVNDTPKYLRHICFLCNNKEPTLSHSHLVICCTV